MFLKAVGVSGAFLALRTCKKSCQTSAVTLSGFTTLLFFDGSLMVLDGLGDTVSGVG